MSPKVPKNNVFKQRELYTATKGVENEGYEFEVAMLSYYGFHLSYNTHVKDMKIAIYDDYYHPFDDVVINVRTNQDDKYAFQLKHVKDKLLLNVNHFGRNGKMVLNKYFRYDFSKSDHVVLFTNGVVKEELKIGNFTIRPKQETTFMENIFDTFEDQDAHIYEITNEDCDGKIIFFTSQKNRYEIEEEVKNYFIKKFWIQEDKIEKIYGKYKSFFQMWKKGYYETCKLDKQDIKMKIAEILFYDSIINYHLTYVTTIDKKTQCLHQILNKFDITLITDHISEPDITRLCRTELTMEELVDYGKKFLINSKTGNVFDKKAGFILWHLRKIPLIVKVNNDNKKMIIELIKDLHKEGLSFIAMGKFLAPDDFPNLKIFINLENLSINYQEVTEKFHLSIQGQNSIFLKDLIACNPAFDKIISMRELILMLQDNFCIGGNKEVLPEPYIPRKLLLKTFKIESIDQVPNDTFLVNGNCKALKSKLRKKEVFYYHKNILLSSLPPKSVVVCDHNADNFFQSLIKHRNNVHWVQVVDNNYLKLIASKEESEKLKKIRLISENQLYCKCTKNVNLICARSGMGKSTLLKFLKNNCPSGHWTVGIDFQENDNQNQIEDDFTIKVKNCFEEAGKCIYFYHGFENLPNNKLIDAANHIRQLAEKGFQIWIFTEEHQGGIFEKILGISSISIEEFNEEDQKQYIQKRLSKNKLNQNFHKILMNFQTLKNNDILGAPMHLFMLTEVFINNPKAKMEEIFLLTDIYQYFIKTKFEHYLRKSSHCFHQNQLLEDGMYYRTEQYKLAAANHFFKEANIKCDQNFQNQVASNGDIMGIILKISDEGTVFSQQTYGDYFAALWLVKNYQNLENLQEIIFAEEFKNIYFMFNLELSKQNPAHIAVLYQNQEELQRSNNKLLQLDPLRRSPLHLACSYGTKYQNSENPQSFKFRHKVIKNPRLNQIIDYLMENINFDPLQCDILFGWSMLDYAFLMMNLYAVEKILEILPKIQIPKSEILKNNVYPIVYYSVKFGYKNLVKLMSDYFNFGNLIELENCNGETLLHLAARSGNLETIKILVENNANINKPTNAYHTRSPLHIAIQNGHHEVVKYLTAQGALIDIMDRHRCTPLQLAASKADLSSAELLVALGADANFADNFGRQPLHRAAASGGIEMLDFLIKQGADLNHRNKLGQSPLEYAFYNHRMNAFKFLLKKGAINNLPMMSRRKSEDDFEEYVDYPLHWAAIIGQTEEINRLIEDGYEINNLDKNGQTPLHYAIMKRQSKIAKLLIFKGASVNKPNIKNVTPIFYAINNEDIDLINLLLNHGGTFDVADFHHRTPLHWSAVHCSELIVKLVLSQNPNLEVFDCFRRRPIDYAAESGNHEIIDLLSKEINIKLIETAKLRSKYFEKYEGIPYNIEASSLTLSPFLNAVDYGNVALLKKLLNQEYNIDETDDLGYTALHRAVVKEHIEVVSILLEESAKLEDFGHNISLLHFAAFCGNPEIAKALVKNGAEVNKKDDFGYSAVHIAAMQGHVSTLSFLILANGNYNEKDFFQNTPLDWGCKEGHVEIVKLLLERNAIAGTVQGAHLDMATCQNNFFQALKKYYTKF